MNAQEIMTYRMAAYLFPSLVKPAIAAMQAAEEELQRKRVVELAEQRAAMTHK